MGVQILDTTAVNTVDIKDFNLKRVGDVNENGKIDIRDMVRMAKGLKGTETVDELVGDYDNSTAFDGADITAVREKILNTDKLADVLRGKTVSILGDSISTYDGYNNNIFSNTTTSNNAVCYYNTIKWDYMTVNDTYWKQIIDITETRLLVNNAWSGSSIARQGGANRGVQLHDNYGYYEGKTPDIILVHYGTNDCRSQNDIVAFEKYYDEMIEAIKNEYSDAEIYLFTFPLYTEDIFESDTAKETLINFNSIIRTTAEKYTCQLVDLYQLENYDLLSFDDVHPNKAGMDAITDTLYNVMYKQYLE